MKNIRLKYDVTRPIDVICMGRVAVDLYAEQINTPLSKVESFKKYLGGCAGNIAVGTARLGLKSMMFSCVGADEMGEFLKTTLAVENVMTDLVYESRDHLTGLVLLGISPPNHFPLMFYRNNCADMQLQPEHLKKDLLHQTKALVVTGTGLSTASMRTATHYSVDMARQAGTVVILDLDFRPVLWSLTSVGDGETRYQKSLMVTTEYQHLLAKCDLIVGTEEELFIASGQTNINDAMKVMHSRTDAIIVVKMGVKGCKVFYSTEDESIESPAFPIDILNVLGAGDAFMSGLLRGLLKGEDYVTATQYANACGAIVVTRHGCAPAMPYWDELNYFIKHYPVSEPLLNNLHERLLQQCIDKSGHPIDKPKVTPFLISAPEGYKDGLTSIVTDSQLKHASGMDFCSLKLKLGESFDLTSAQEMLCLLMTGRVIFKFANQQYQVQRVSYFDEEPVALHCAAQTKAIVIALTDCELLLIATENDQDFAPLLFDKTNLLEIDQRGKGLLNNTSHRIVRTIFDKRNRAQSNLVVGEIISFQGQWSSYPPHYHPQAEIYHYRFSEPQGFAFAEHGKEVIRIKHNDTYQILNGKEHAHCTAPGYALYTLWFIRHLPNNPYLQPTFRNEHEWTRHPNANKRVWRQQG